MNIFSVRTTVAMLILTMSSNALFLPHLVCAPNNYNYILVLFFTNYWWLIVYETINKKNANIITQLLFYR